MPSSAYSSSCGQRPRPTAGRAVQAEDREPVAVAPDRVGQRAAIGRLERPQRLPHVASITLPGGIRLPRHPQNELRSRRGHVRCASQLRRADMDAADKRGNRNGEQTLLRAANDRVVGVGGRDPADVAQFVCECGERGCATAILVTVREYAEIRADPAMLIVAPDHVPDGHELVDRCPGYSSCSRRRRTRLAAVRVRRLNGSTHGPGASTSIGSNNALRRIRPPRPGPSRRGCRRQGGVSVRRGRACPVSRSPGSPDRTVSPPGGRSGRAGAPRASSRMASGHDRATHHVGRRGRLPRATTITRDSRPPDHPGRALTRASAPPRREGRLRPGRALDAS